MARKKGVVLLSGGIDSSTLLYYLRSQEHSLLPITFKYGQRHEKEVESARAIAISLNLSIKVVDISGLGLFGGSSLTDDIPIPEGHYTDESMKLTIVPNRNMVFLSLATAYAVSMGCEYVAYAAHAGDHFIYPDCRPEFIDSIAYSIKLATGNVGLVTPFSHLSKAGIVRLGLGLKVPYLMTWSCYKGDEVACGRCGTCVERLEAFSLNNEKDPIDYMAGTYLDR